MGEFITEKETERLLELETRYLPIPEPCSASENRLITVFKKKPVTMFRKEWGIYDLLVDERFNIYTKTHLALWVAEKSLETKADLNTSFSDVIATAFNSYKETNLPILREIDDLANELEEVERRLKESGCDGDE